MGQATLLDVRQAEVIKGQSDVALLRAVQTENEAKLDLIRRMGVEPPVPVEQIALTDSFPVTAPSFDLDTLLAAADAHNPALRSLGAQTAAAWNVRAAKSEFLPTLSLQAGWSGFTQQFTNEGLLLNQSLASAQAQAADCQFNNQVRSGLNLGGEVPNCFAAAGLVDGGSALLDPVSQQIRAPTTPSHSATPDSRFRPTCGCRCRSSPGSVVHFGSPRPRQTKKTLMKTRGPGDCKCEATCTRASWPSRRRIRRSPSSRPIGRRHAISSGWPRTVIGSARALHSKCRMRRTPFSGLKVTT